MASTIKDIRRVTGLSLATISKYLNGGNVRPDNKKAIEAAIKDLNYHRNELARSLVTNRSHMYGFIVHNISNIFASTMIHYAGDILRERNYGLLVCDSSNDVERERSNIEFLVSRSVDAIILISAANDESTIEPAVRAGVPVVYVDRDVSGMHDSVTVNNQEAVTNAVQLLLRKGHTRIAAISSREYTGKMRLAGYYAAMRAAGLEPRSEYVELADKFEPEFGYQAIMRLVALPEPPTAVLMCNYEITNGVLNAANENNIRIPDQISLIGFDNLGISRLAKPALTIVDQPVKEELNAAIDILMDRIHDKEHTGNPRRVELFCRLDEHDSVADLTQDVAQV